MIIKYHKGFNTVIVAITVSVIVIAFTFNSTNFGTINKQKINIIVHDVNQKIMSLDLGISSTRNLLDDGIKDVNNDIPQRLIALIKNMPNIFHYKFPDNRNFLAFRIHDFFYKQLVFLVSTGVAYFFAKFQYWSCLAIFQI